MFQYGYGACAGNGAHDACKVKIMNKFALFHQPESRFAYATADNGLTVILRASADDNLTVEILYNNKYDFTKKRSVVIMQRCAVDGIFAYYRVKLKFSDARFAYIFRITENDKVYYYSEEGLSTDYNFECAYYTFFQFPYINSVDVMPVVDWTREAVFYQIFVDRFARGNVVKDDSYINTCWDGEIDRYSFTGGDLCGVREKLPYLKSMGINAIYLTPVFLSPTNHKYNITDYLAVDPQFGGDGELKAFLVSAKKLGIKVVIDTVFNHCDVSHKRFRDVLEKGRKSKYYNCFIIDGDYPDVSKGNYAYFADCKYMPKWNTNDAETRKYLIDIALAYLNIGFDGLRLDVADEISHEMWRQLRKEVKNKFPEALILGEIWHESEQWLKGDQLDGVMNFKLQKILVDYFGLNPITAERASERMNGLLMKNTEQANAMALNFLDNHDTPRFLRFAGGNSDKVLCALCAMIMYPGMPCIFYGTELPLDGGGDPDCRKTFDWTFTDSNEQYAEAYKQIIALKSLRPLCGGECEISADGGLLKIARTKDIEKITAYFNTSGKDIKLAQIGETIFTLNCDNDRIFDNGAVVIKNIL